MIKLQLELSFNCCQPFTPAIRHRRRLTRARWWFERMRAVVDGAREWRPAPLPRPEQTDLALPSPRQ